jgi:hypothetical protein
MDVRRLAALDMWGARGTMRRRRIIVAEFVLGLIAMIGIGVWLFGATHGGNRVLGAWMIGAGLNYAPLAAHAVSLYRPGALDAELAGVDTMRELRRYGALQFWIFVPLSMLAVQLATAVRGRRP